MDADVQRKGIGKTLMMGIQKQLAKENIHTIMLNTERGYPAHSFYENIGFKREEGLCILYQNF